MTEADALFVAESGADAIGLNFVASSKRRIEKELARRIADVVRERFGSKVEMIGVFADQPSDEVLAIQRSVGLDGIQLHGAETPEELEGYLGSGARAFKAVRIADASDVQLASGFAGDRILLDAKFGTALGGTGHTFDWSLAATLVETKRVVVAGGLTPDNVGQLLRQCRPYGVDTASGVEDSIGRKSPALVNAFVAACRTVPTAR